MYQLRLKWTATGTYDIEVDCDGPIPSIGDMLDVHLDPEDLPEHLRLGMSRVQMEGGPFWVESVDWLIRKADLGEGSGYAQFHIMVVACDRPVPVGVKDEARPPGRPWGATS